MVDIPKIGGEDSGESSLDGLNTTVNLAGDGHGLVAELDLGGEGSLKDHEYAAQTLATVYKTRKIEDSSSPFALECSCCFVA